MAPDSIPTNVAAEQYDKHRLRGLAHVAEDNREDLQRGLVDLVSALGWLRDGGDASGVHSYLSELAKVARDGICARDAECRKDIDNADFYCEPIDLAELDDFIARIA